MGVIIQTLLLSIIADQEQYSLECMLNLAVNVFDQKHFTLHENKA